MRLLAVGFGLLDVALVVQALDPEAHLRLLVAAIAAISAVCTYMGFGPPLWLRIIMRQPEQQRLRSAVAGIASAVTEADVLEALLPATRDVLGVGQVALVPFGDPERADIIASGYDEQELDEIRAGVHALEAHEGTTSALLDGRLANRSAASWVVVDRPRGGAFFGADELEVLSSIDSIVRLSLRRIRDATAIYEHEQQLQTAVDIAELGKWHWSVEELDVWWSPRMYDIFGLEGDDPITYERYQQLLAPEERSRLGSIVEHSLATGEPYQIDHRIVRLDGSEAWLHSRARVQFDDRGTARRVTGITMDVTERVRIEQELRDEIEVEREVARRLRALDELKTNILSAVSHELRTPLAAVHGLGVVLQDRMEEFEPAKRREIVDHLVDQADRLARLFADLLDIDRLRRGVVEAHRVDVDVAQLVLDIVNERERRDRIVVDLEPGMFALDAPKFERIIENLVVNAEKYAGHEPLVRVLLAYDDDGLELVVEDDGPGVDERLREAIFEPFNRGDEELGYAPGTGIGLSLVRQFTDLHGGRVWVERGAAGGARFVVRIPRRDAASDRVVADVG
jgi:PAS domain S-box-containing protein